MRRTLWPFALTATLVVLLGVLATLQYRWLGEVSNAERDRLHASLRARAAEFTDAFDREITRLYVAFQIDADALNENAAGRLAEAYASAQSAGTGLVRQVFLMEAPPEGDASLRGLDPIARTLTAAPWPPALEAWKLRASRGDRVTPVRGLSPLFVADAIDPRTPALFVPLPVMKRVDEDRDVAFMPDPTGRARMIVVWLDAGRLRGFVAALAEKHFGAGETSEYLVRVVGRDNPADVVYASGPEDVTAASADVTAGLFDLRFDELTRFTVRVPPPGTPGTPGTPGRIDKNKLAITIVRRAPGQGGAHMLMAGGDHQGAWQVLVRGRSGSLDALVARSRRRNLAIGIGVLALLAVSFGFVLASAQRQRRLARQQMEFVAAVSHELRTPLAVIQSAGENLADGVVADGDQVRRYGSLIRAEGRRLTDMVERVMEFAGISSGSAARSKSDVDVVRVVGDAVAAVQPDARERGIVLTSTAGVGAALVVGDGDALRSAVQNIVGNAVKYSPAGGRVDVTTDLEHGRVRITVTDRGLGIDAADLPHVFKPFYRGQRAVDAQIRGTGVGLSVVRNVVDAHGGAIDLESRAGEGTTVTVRLPAATPDQAVRDLQAGARATT